ncbi:MAG: histidine--tRNA ligase [Flavobacteriaceae bacterium]|nr:histidine--tRNA ligase [Flavobacteriaceae bacterium]PHX77281.1 MAG: histidine--tRNA ligase [Flavobacteriales bacterium]
MEKPSLPSGTRDFSPKVMLFRKYITSVMERIFLSHGFGALETPSLENLRTLQGKYGNEGDQLLFKVLNSGDFLSKADAALLSAKDSKGLTPQISDRGLRYDLTVPLARFVVMNRNEIVFPFKRYQMQPVWRADRPQKGRYREFWQCDIDVVGANSVVSEAELVEMYQEVFAALDLGVKIRINHRGILDAFVRVLGTRENWNAFMIIIDKADKIGFEGVAKELEEKGLSMSLNAWKWLWDSKSVSGNSEKMLLAGGTDFLQGEALSKGLSELEIIFGLLGNTGNVELDFTLARGLSYYTGAVFEVEAVDGRLPSDFRLGSIGGGGRYDNLTGVFGLKDVSGVGVSFGLDRVYDTMEAAGLFDAMEQAVGGTLVCAMDASCEVFGAGVARALRARGLTAEMYPGTPKLKKQLDYANDKKMGFAVIIGNEELQANKVALKNLVTGEQVTGSVEEIAAVIAASV